MILLNENGEVVYTNPIHDEVDEPFMDEEIPATEEEKRIAELEAQITDLQLALCEMYEAAL